MLTRPDVLLRLESFLFLFAAVIGYRLVLHGHWLWFAVFFLVPDLSLAGYLFRNGRVAASIYNAIHSYFLPVVLGFAAWGRLDLRLGQIAAIWIAHIAFDRVLGFGLKYSEGFKPTHIQSAAVYREM